MNDVQFQDVDIRKNSFAKKMNEIDEKYDYIKFSFVVFETKVLLDRLKNLGTLIKTGSGLKEKLIFMRVGNGIASFIMNASGINVEVQVGYLNSRNPLVGDYIIDYTALLSILKNAGDEIIFQLKGRRLHIKVLNGDVQLEDYNIDSSYFEVLYFDDEHMNQSRVVTRFPDLVTFLERADKSVQLARSASDKRIRIEKATDEKYFSGYAQYRSCLVEFTDIPIEVYSLREIDIKFLLKMLNSISDDLYFLNLGDEGCLFSNDWIRILIPQTDVSDLDIRETIEQINEPCHSLMIDGNAFSRIINILTGSNSDYVSFTDKDLNADGNACLSAAASDLKNRKYRFSISEIEESREIETTFESDILKKAVQIINKEEFIRIDINLQGVFILNVENIRIIFPPQI